MMKLVIIVGTRPEIIQSSILIQQLRIENWLTFQVWNTGQHYNYRMSEIFQEELNVHPDRNFGVGSGSPMEQITNIMIKTEKALTEYRPDLIVVFGDTNSTLGAALAAKKLNIPIAHIESGPREQVYDGKNFHRKLFMNGYPEEINRIIVDNCSEILFAPTKDSVLNLEKESILGNIIFVGDIGYEILLKNFPSWIPKSSNYNLITIHRVENTDDIVRLKGIVNALLKSKTPIIFPLHPRTRKALEEFGLINLLIKNSLIHVCEPVGYCEMLNLMNGAKYILTDSGGIQREAFYLEVPCLTLRNNTGWVETVKCGANKLIEIKDIAKELDKTPSFPSQIESIFGDGTTSLKIIEYIKKWWFSK